MIRIDEIYNHTFWPWLDKHCEGTRLFFCDPFGHTNPEHLFNMGRTDIKEKNYVFMHDQEPVDVSLFDNLFQEVLKRNTDVWWPNKPNPFGHIVVSEKGSEVQRACDTYEWTAHYYFFHGWACLDWFRGYDKTFLIPRAQDRRPTRTFMSPNRIVAGKRDHRVLFLYNVFKNQLEHNHISAPRTCQYENVDISSIAQKYTNVYQDITDVFKQAELPRLFVGEDQQEMASCWLTNFTEAQDSLVYVPTETVYFGHRTHITEKTFKAIALEMPFVLVATAGSLEYLREYGFQTFAGIFDESYDTETDDIRRVEKVTRLLKELDSLSIKERADIHRACLPVVEHNYNHFYRGGFSDILWTELVSMLNNLQNKLL
jgi:predicted nucleotidyltransferase